MVRKESIVQITIFLTMVYCFMAVIHNSIFEEGRFVYFTRFSFFLYLLALTIQLVYKFRYKQRRNARYFLRETRNSMGDPRSRKTLNEFKQITRRMAKVSLKYTRENTQEKMEN
jgi:hypothetical protein